MNRRLVKILSLTFGLMLPAVVRADVPASASGGGPAAIKGRGYLSRLTLQNKISSYRDPCWGSSLFFNGPSDSGSGQTPPYVVKFKACLPVQGLPADPQIAAGPTRLVLTNQTRVAFYDKSGTYHGSLSAASFFSPLGLDDGTINGLDTFRDLRVVYDDHRQRFWMGGTVTNGGQLDPAQRRVGFVVAVSQSNNPLGNWWLYWWDAVSGYGDPASSVYQAGDVAEDPFIAVDDFGFHQTNLVRNGPYRRYWRVSFFPAALANGTPASGWQYWDLKNPNGTAAWMVQPAMHHGAAPLTYYASRQGTSDVVVWGLQDPLGPTQSISRVAVTSETPWLGPLDAPQMGSWQKIEMSRMGNGVLKAVYRKDQLHLVTNDAAYWYPGTPPLTSVRVLRLGVSGFPVVSIGADSLIGKRSPHDDEPEARMYYGWPSAEVNTQGQMAIVLGRSGEQAHPEIRWSLLKSGASAHAPTFRVEYGWQPYQIPGNNSSVLPWGEAAGASVDPFDDLSIWLAHQAASPGGGGAAGNYSIWVAKVLGTVIPDLHLFIAVIDPQRTDPGMPVDVLARIFDEGDGPADPFRVDYTLVREDGFSVPLGSYEHPAMKPGEASEFRQTFKIPVETPQGRYRVKVVADPENRLQEYSERNNTAVTEGQIEVLAPAQ